MEDHCWLVANGIDWRIVEMDGLRRLSVVNRRGERAMLDLRAVDWSSYTAKAVELMRWQYEFA